MPHLHYTGSSFYIFAQKPDWDVIAGKDVVVVQRCCTQPQFDFLKTAGALGMRIVYDLDDNVWELPEYNPAARVLNMHREGFNACIRMVDVVSVSTRTLAKALRKHVKFMINMRTHKEIPIVVTENRIAECMFVDPVRKPEVIIGWSGSSSHVGDFGVLEEALAKVAVDHPKGTKQVRMLLCQRHNMGIGYFGHDARLLRAAADYLDAHGSIPGPKEA